MIGEAIALIFGISGVALWYIGSKGADMAIFRVLFIFMGFITFAAGFAILATLTASYIGVDYTIADINTLSSLLYGFMYLFFIGGILYLAIEIMLYLARTAALVRQKKDNPYDFETRKKRR